MTLHRLIVMLGVPKLSVDLIVIPIARNLRNKCIVSERDQVTVGSHGRFALRDDLHQYPPRAFPLARSRRRQWAPFGAVLFEISDWATEQLRLFYCRQCTTKVQITFAGSLSMRAVAVPDAIADSQRLYFHLPVQATIRRSAITVVRDDLVLPMRTLLSLLMTIVCHSSASTPGGKSPNFHYRIMTVHPGFRTRNNSCMTFRPFSGDRKQRSCGAPVGWRRPLLPFLKRSFRKRSTWPRKPIAKLRCARVSP